MSWINTHVDYYYNWLREKTVIQEDHSTEWTLISTPFLGAFNDTIEIYAKKNGSHLTLSDNGETISNLELQGVHIQGSKKRRYLVDAILLNYGIREINDELIVETNFENFAQSKHNLLSAIIEINDMYILSKSNVSSIFKEDVRNYLDEIGLIYTPDFISKGVTGLEFNFDFQIAKRNEEIVLKSFNTVNKSNLSSFLFSWEDIKPVREKITKKNVTAIAVINDIGREIKTEFLDALNAKEADYILWSERDSDRNRKLLVA
ncbi:DUF1828 domain-containing protein [Flavobacterium sp. J372]|uniref:DUF1828 domain-containing protein n=1 Tax=Flavobacterium sp. J372 TaxID=2898436 RepID=UPI0021512BB7|nr:DUF1828 domain-containing protein [Flavobacterium sp. J372]MCR5862179.1 DUF1828 domain-containing protein [Flavobacterium sp. J372]